MTTQFESLDDFLAEEGILEEVTISAQAKIIEELKVEIALLQGAMDQIIQMGDKYGGTLGFDATVQIAREAREKSK